MTRVQAAPGTSALRRWPRGYQGIHHETIGSDILSVFEAVHDPILTLGEEHVRRLQEVRAEAWYPIGDLLDIMEMLDQQLGLSGLRKLGRSLWRISHQGRLRSSLRSARDVVYGFDHFYHHANRGEQIGGWSVISFSAGRAELEKTTPHHCHMEEGILLEALASMGISASISQPDCFRRGDDLCVYVIRSDVSDRRWTG